MSISPTDSPRATTLQTHTTDHLSSTKRKQLSYSSLQEDATGSLEAKKIRRVPSVPAFAAIVDPTDEVKTITANLLPLFRKPDASIEARLLATVDYIEKHRKTLIEIACFELRFIIPNK